MACTLAENRPLGRLRRALGIAPSCHSPRSGCIMGYERPAARDAFGAPGAVIGYCQALFNRSGSPADHTRRVVRLLEGVNAPWSRSHEMFWGHRQDSEGAAEFIENGVQPLRSAGRVPILITGLDPDRDESTLSDILRCSPAVVPGETVLLRVVLASEASMWSAASFVRSIVRDAQSRAHMPKWWLLLQGELSVVQWMALRRELDDVWNYVNIAVNPFTPPDVVKAVADQVTVAQIPVGLASGIQSDGTIELAPGMRISEARERDRYCLPQYLENLRVLPEVPTLIVLGPSMPDWSDAQNQERIHALLPQLHQGCELLWRDLSPARRQMVWRLPA